MQSSTVSFISLIIASLLCLAVADTTVEVTNEVDAERELGNRKKKMKRKNFRKNKNKKHNTWKEPNHWNKPNSWKEPKDEYVKLVLMESECTYNYVSSNADDTGTDVIPLNPDGTLNTETGVWKVGSHVFKSCVLFDKGQTHGPDGMYYGPLKAGQTDMTCLVTSIEASPDDPTNPESAGNSGFLDCTIVDTLLPEVYSTATLRSQGYMGLWDSDFKAATIGGTGGGIGASGQMRYMESEYSNKFVHYYYIVAPYIKKGFAW